MTIFRPCLDLHDGKVKQIVGSTLDDSGREPQTNFVADELPTAFAERYRDDGLIGGHVIKLGAGNDDAARAVLRVWPGGFQLGGGITFANARQWIDEGADKVIVTSWLFPGAVFALERLAALSLHVGRRRLVVDLSCRRVGDDWFVAIDRWQTVTDFALGPNTLQKVARYCDELLVHAVDVEGLARGIDASLVTALGDWSPIPCTYAGGANDLADLATVQRLSRDRVDLTFGSALDIFGGQGVRYRDCVAWNQARREDRPC